MRKFNCLFNDLKLEGWSSEKAYLLGLLVTDGTITKRKNSLGYRYVQFKLADKDIDILEKLSRWLEFRGSFYFSETRHKSGNVIKAVTLALVSKNLEAFITEMNLSNDKTKSVGIMRVPSNYMKDYIRGFVDGDGSIHSRYVLTISSFCLDPLSQIKDEIYKATGIEGRLHKENIWRLEYSRKELSIPVLEWIYESGISMNRKRDLALSMRSNVKRRRYGG